MYPLTINRLKFLKFEHKVIIKNLTILAFLTLTHFLIIEPIRVQIYKNVLFPIISKYSHYVFDLVGADFQYQIFIMHYFREYKFVDVIIPFGVIFWVPFLFLFALKMKTLCKVFFIYHTVLFVILYPIGIFILTNFEVLNLFFDLFKMIMIFIGLTFCIVGARQSVRVKS